MLDFLETGWGKLLAILLGVVVIVVACLSIGAGIGLFSGVVLPELVATAGAMIGGTLLLLLAVVSAVWLTGKALDDLQGRIKKQRGAKGSSWAQYLGAVVGVLIGVGASALGTSPLFGLLFGLTAAILALLAANLIEGRTWLGLLVYAVVVAGAALAIAFTTTPEQLQDWLTALTPIDIAVIAMSILVAVSPLAAGLYVKLRRRRAQT